MDAFYAAVEQRDDPDLRGRPVIVGGLGRRGVVATASYEAREFGVHSALPTEIARRRCPDGVFVRPRMDVYLGVSEAIREVFDAYTDCVEPLSLDEAFLDVTGSQRLFGDGPTIARAIRQRVQEVTALTVSVGVAGNKFMAKVASDIDKPDGLTVVPLGKESEFLAPLPIRRLWGVGPKTAERLQALGCRTVGDVQAIPVDRLVASLGRSSGEHIAALSRGHDERPVAQGGGARSIGRETTFGDDLTEESACLDVLLRLSADVGSRLRAAGLAAGTVRLKLRHPPFETLARQLKMSPATQDDVVIYQAARELYLAANPGGRSVRLLGVTGADLGPADQPTQGELFGPTPRAASKIDTTLDAIRAKFGGAAVGRAGVGQDGIGRPNSDASGPPGRDPDPDAAKPGN